MDGFFSIFICYRFQHTSIAMTPSAMFLTTPTKPYRRRHRHQTGKMIRNRMTA